MHAVSAVSGDATRDQRLSALLQALAAGSAMTIWLSAAWHGVHLGSPWVFLGYVALGAAIAWFALPGRSHSRNAMQAILVLTMLYVASSLSAFGSHNLGYLLLLPWMGVNYMAHPLGTRGRKRIATALAVLVVGAALIDFAAAPQQPDHAMQLLHVLAATGFSWLVAVGFLRLTGDLEARAQDSADNLTEQVKVDRLTWLSNRVHLEQSLDAEMARAQRSDEPLSVVLVDIDGMKSINDRHGHAAGDAVLRATASTLQRALRPYDHVGRWDGEEFLIVMPRTSALVAGTVCERLRQLLDHAMRSASASVPQFTVSFGVAPVDVKGPKSAAVAEADGAVKFAKQHGVGHLGVMAADGPRVIPPIAL